MITFKNKLGETEKILQIAPVKKRLKLAYKSIKLHKQVLEIASGPVTMAQLKVQIPWTHPKTLGYHVRQLIKMGKLEMVGSASRKGDSAATYSAV